MSTQTATVTVRRHPVRGALWALPMGIGLTWLLIAFGVLALGTPTPLAVAPACMLLGIVWGLLAPAKKPKGDAPLPLEPVVADAPVTPPPPPPPPPPVGPEAAADNDTPAAPPASGPPESF